MNIQKRKKHFLVSHSVVLLNTVLIGRIRTSGLGEGEKQACALVQTNTIILAQLLGLSHQLDKQWPEGTLPSRCLHLPQAPRRAHLAHCQCKGTILETASQPKQLEETAPDKRGTKMQQRLSFKLSDIM